MNLYQNICGYLVAWLGVIGLFALVLYASIELIGYYSKTRGIWKDFLQFLRVKANTDPPEPPDWNDIAHLWPQETSPVRLGGIKPPPTMPRPAEPPKGQGR